MFGGCCWVFVCLLVCCFVLFFLGGGVLFGDCGGLFVLFEVFFCWIVFVCLFLFCLIFMM